MTSLVLESDSRRALRRSDHAVLSSESATLATLPYDAPWLILMIKAPLPGRVKTRLATEIGDTRATAIYRRFVEYIVSHLFSIEDRIWQPVIAYTPSDQLVALDDWLGPLVPPETQFFDQEEGDLGERLERVFGHAFQSGAGSAIAIGADCLEITPADLRAAIHLLHRDALVMGPAGDGGYWLIGMNGPHYRILHNVPWETSKLAEATRARARTLGVSLSELPLKSDVDTKEDLDRLPAHIAQEIGLDILRGSGADRRA